MQQRSLDALSETDDQQDKNPPPTDWFVDENGRPENIYGQILAQYEVVTTPAGRPLLRKKSLNNPA